MGPGAVFGELSLLTGEPRSATVVAATPAVVQEIRKEDLERMLRAHPELAERFAEVVTDRRLADERRAGEHVGRELDRMRSSMIEVLLDKAHVFFKLNGSALRASVE